MNEKSIPSPFSINKSVDGLAEPTRVKVRAQLAHLEGMMGAHNFELRDDSRLAFLWATGKLDLTWDASEVCHEMMSMQFICANTAYNDLAQPFLRALAKGLKERYNLKSWTTTWRIVREYGPDILKIMSLVDAGVRIPNFQMYSGEAVSIQQDACTGTTQSDESEATVTAEGIAA